MLLQCFISGIYYTMALIGPAAGYIIGGQLLLLHTDFMHEDATKYVN